MHCTVVVEFVWDAIVDPDLDLDLDLAALYRHPDASTPTTLCFASMCFFHFNQLLLQRCWCTHCLGGNVHSILINQTCKLILFEWLQCFCNRRDFEDFIHSTHWSPAKIRCRASFKLPSLGFDQLHFQALDYVIIFTLLLLLSQPPSFISWY